jgi:hypothetical protein
MAYSSLTPVTAGQVGASTWANQVDSNFDAAFPLGVDAWTAYTPTLTQGAAVAKTVNYAKYQRIGRTIHAVVDLTLTAAGAAPNDVLVGLPVAAAAFASGPHWGTMLIYDASTTTRYQGAAEARTTTTVALSWSQASAAVWGTTPNLALASGDIIRLNLTYEAAS